MNLAIKKIKQPVSKMISSGGEGAMKNWLYPKPTKFWDEHYKYVIFTNISI